MSYDSYRPGIECMFASFLLLYYISLISLLYPRFFFQVQFPGITGGNLMYVEEKLFRKKKENVLPWANSIILEGNKIFTLTGLRASTEYRLRWLAPDRQYPDTMVTTRGE